MGGHVRWSDNLGHFRSRSSDLRINAGPVIHHTAEAARVACGLGGAMTVKKIGDNPAMVKLTFNVSFSDGTTWVDRTFTTPLPSF